jgi:hypothetical protein
MLKLGAQQNCKKVCFNVGSRSGCSIDVVCDNEQCDSGYVAKGNSRVYFVTDALLYGAIFSPVKEYSCNVDRLMNRLDLLCQLYIEKARSLPSGCSNTAMIQSYLNDLKSNALGSEASSNLAALVIAGNRAGDENSELSCPIF